MKICFKCKIKKELTEFYKHSQMLDGYLNKCKECNKKDVNQNRISKIDYYKEYDKNRAMLPHRVQQRKEYLNTDFGKIVKSKSNKNYLQKFPLKKIAVQTVNNHLRKNPSFRQPCIYCGNKAQAHHYDYSKPLDVIWLCTKHHVEEHKKLKESGIKL